MAVVTTNESFDPLTTVTPEDADAVLTEIVRVAAHAPDGSPEQDAAREQYKQIRGDVSEKFRPAADRLFGVRYSRSAKRLVNTKPKRVPLSEFDFPDDLGPLEPTGGIADLMLRGRPYPTTEGVTASESFDPLTTVVAPRQIWPPLPR